MKTLLVMAAGMGSRFGGLKQMAAMGPHGETLLDYAVFDARRAGFDRVVFVIRAEFATAFKHQISERYAGPVDYVLQDLHDLPPGFTATAERSKPWGTLHAVWSARHLVDGPFAVINADDFYGQDAYRKVAGFLSSPQAPAPAAAIRSHYCMLGYRLANTLSGHGGVNRGICAQHQGFLTRVEEFKNIVADRDGHCCGSNQAGQTVNIAPDAVVSMNIWGFTPAIFEQMGQHFARFLTQHGTRLTAECYIPDVVDALIRSGQADCRVLTTNSAWFGVTYPQDQSVCADNIASLVRAGAYPVRLFDSFKIPTGDNP
jgi:hypothetical protein